MSDASPGDGHGLRFDNSFVATLPGDPDMAIFPRTVNRACYSRVRPTPVKEPRLIAYAPEVAALLGLEADAQSPSLAAVLSGNALWRGMEPYAACYGGHQFGHWAGQLGDGRAITLGEVVSQGAGGRFDIQLKGAGRTPYSRTADGRAVLRSSLREFVASEAMHALGVPTTRALSLAVTGDLVIRDMFYDGNAQAEPGAIVCRVAPSFLRFGNYELFAARDDHETLRRLADYTLRTHFPHLVPQKLHPGGELAPEIYAAWLAEVARTTARLVVGWMRVGFTHGVMNTDNMSILGLTIDYGPFGFLDSFDPAFTPNTTDAERRRYRFGQQPQVARWNLLKLGEALLPLLGGQVAMVGDALTVYADTFTEEQERMLAGKLGFSELRDQEDGALCDDLFTLLQAAETDYTLFFRGLAEVSCEALVAAQSPDQAPDQSSGHPSGHRAAQEERALAALRPAYYGDTTNPQVRATTLAWLTRYAHRAVSEGLPDRVRGQRMNAVNPLYLCRNYLAQEAIDAVEAGDLTVLLALVDTLRRPYDEQEGRARFAAPRPEWARHRAGCSMLSCSS